jgi:GNAT superfamily N-acetyltransferase
VHEYTKYFYDGDLERLQGLFTDEMKQQLTLEQLVALRRRVESEYGNEIAVLGEETQTKGKYRGFVRWARFDKHPGPIEVQWILREDDSIAGFFVRPVKRNRG